MNKEQIQNKAKALVESLSDKQLIDAFIDIIGREKNADNNHVRLWLLDEIESRFDYVRKVIVEYYESGEDYGLTYDQMVLKAIEESVNV